MSVLYAAGKGSARLATVQADRDKQSYARAMRSQQAENQGAGLLSNVIALAPS